MKVKLIQNIFFYQFSCLCRDKQIVKNVKSIPAQTIFFLMSDYEAPPLKSKRNFESIVHVGGFKSYQYFLFSLKVKHIRHLGESQRNSSKNSPRYLCACIQTWRVLIWSMVVPSAPPCCGRGSNGWNIVGKWTVWLDLPHLIQFAHLQEHCIKFIHY